MTAWLGFLAYLVLLAYLALRSARSAGQSEAEYYLGGRSLGTWVVALSAVASGRSSWLLLSMSGLAFAFGLSAVWFLPGYIAAELFMFAGPGRRLRRHTGEHDDVTVGDYFASRFPNRAVALRIVYMAAVILFLAPYIAAQLTAGAKGMHAAFGWKQPLGLWVTAAVVLAYVVVGGFRAVSLTDTVQAVLMVVALVVLPIVVLVSLGGIAPVFAELRTAGQLSPLALGGGFALTGLAVGLGSPGSPHILVRYMSVSDERYLARAAFVGTTWNVLMGWGALWIGLLARVALSDVADRETVFPLLAQQYLHPALFGLVTAALVAAIMSTVDSQVLIVASAISRDWRRARGRPPLPDRIAARRGRLVSLLLVVAAGALAHYAIAADAEGTGDNPITGLVNMLVLFSWGGLGATLGPAILLALYDRRATGVSTLAAMLTGGILACTWRGLVRPAVEAMERQPNWLAALWPWVSYELTVAFPAALAIAWTAARLKREPEPH